VVKRKKKKRKTFPLFYNMKFASLICFLSFVFTYEICRLGHRYSEKCAFDQAYDYYKRARDLKGNASKSELMNFKLTSASLKDQRGVSGFRSVRTSDKLKQTLLPLPAIETSTSNITALLKINTRSGYDVGTEIDRQKIEARTDFTTFVDRRKGSNTIIYTPPAAGWKPAADLALFNYHRSRAGTG
jgi:hypothetical protein